MANFDFDHWCELASGEPARYYRERERVISAFIDAQPAEEAIRLRELQAQVDATRALAGAPLKATRQIIGMMQDRLEAMHARLLELQEETDRISQAMKKTPGE